MESRGEITPDVARQELARRELIRRQSMGGNNESKKSTDTTDFERITGINRSPLDSIRDVASGASSGLGKGGQFLASKLYGDSMPKVDMDEMFDPISSPNKSIGGDLLKGVGEYAPYAVAGGASLPGLLAGGAAHGAATAKPDQSNLLGLMPSGALGGALTGSLLNALGFGGFKLLQNIPKAINAFNPGATSSKLIESIGGTKNPVADIPINPWRDHSVLKNIPSNKVTATENAERIANTLNTSAEMQKESALSHLQPVKKEIGRKDISSNPIETIPEGNLDKVTKLFDRKKNDVRPEEADEAQRAIQRFRKHEDFEKLQEEMQDIFGKELSPNKLHDFEEMMDVPHKRDLDYFHGENEDIFDSYGKGLNKLHENFSKSRSFNAAHKLESKLGREKSNLEYRQKMGTIDTNGELRLENIGKAYKDLRNDMDVMVKNQPKHIQDEWATFKKKYRENYKPYESTPALTEITKGTTKGTEPSTIRGIFSHPTQEVQKILKDLPHEGKNYVIYNELAGLKPTDAEGIVNALNKLEQTGGYGKYITPEMRMAKAEIEKKISRQNKLLIPKIYKGSKNFLLNLTK